MTIQWLKEKEQKDIQCYKFKYNQLKCTSWLLEIRGLYCFNYEEWLCSHGDVLVLIFHSFRNMKTNTLQINSNTVSEDFMLNTCHFPQLYWQETRNILEFLDGSLSLGTWDDNPIEEHTHISGFLLEFVFSTLLGLSFLSSLFVYVLGGSLWSYGN